MKTKIVSYRRLRSIHFVSAIALLWGLSDAIISFYVPIQIEGFVHNLTLFGLLLGFSSLIGSLSDPILGFLSGRLRYTILLSMGLLLSLGVALGAMAPFSIILILCLMAAWGLYYEFIEIAVFSYVSRHHGPTEQSRSFGIIYLFMGLPYIIGPLIGGYMVSYGTRALYCLCLLFVMTAILFLPHLAILHRKKERVLLEYKTEPEEYSLRKQLKSFKKVWRYASVFFIAVFLYNVWDAFIWTLVPIQSIGGNAVVAGLITSIFTLPLTVLSSYGGVIADRFGRNVTFVGGLFIASLFTFVFGLQTNIILQVATAALSSLGFAFAYPALMGETSSRGQSHQSQLGNLAAVQRIFVNGGFILGPIIGGYFGETFGLQHAFAVLGAVMLICFFPIAGVFIHFHIKGRVHRSLEAEFEL